MSGSGASTLASYTYLANNGKLDTLTYGNGLQEKYYYDNLDRVSEIWYNTGEGGAIVNDVFNGKRRDANYFLHHYSGSQKFDAYISRGSKFAGTAVSETSGLLLGRLRKFMYGRAS